MRARAGGSGGGWEGAEAQGPREGRGREAEVGEGEESSEEAPELQGGGLG